MSPEVVNCMDSSFPRIVHFRSYDKKIAYTIDASSSFTPDQMSAMVRPMLDRTHYIVVSFGHSLLFTGYTTGLPRVDEVADSKFIDEIRFSMPDSGYGQTSYTDGLLRLLHADVTIVDTSKRLFTVKDVWLDMMPSGRFALR